MVVDVVYMFSVKNIKSLFSMKDHKKKLYFIPLIEMLEWRLETTTQETVQRKCFSIWIH